MALVRCNRHGRPQGTKNTYASEPARPIGYPRTARVCGLSGCEEPGLVWLTVEEYQGYTVGQRVFPIPNSAAAKLGVE